MKRRNVAESIKTYNNKLKILARAGNKKMKIKATLSDTLFIIIEMKLIFKGI